MAGTDDTGQSDWLDADGPENQARESLKDFKHTEVAMPGGARMSGQEVGPVAVQSLGKGEPGLNPGNLETMLDKEPFLQKIGGQSRESPKQRQFGPYLHQIPALEGLCDDGCNRWTDASKHHQVVWPVFYCIVEGFQSFCIITLGSNTEKEKPKLETAFPRGQSPIVDSHKQICLMGNLLGFSSFIGGPLSKPALSLCYKLNEV